MNNYVKNLFKLKKYFEKVSTKFFKACDKLNIVEAENFRPKIKIIVEDKIFEIDFNPDSFDDLTTLINNQIQEHI